MRRPALGALLLVLAAGRPLVARHAGASEEERAAAAELEAMVPEIEALAKEQGEFPSLVKRCKALLNEADPYSGMEQCYKRANEITGKWDKFQELLDRFDNRRDTFNMVVFSPTMARAVGKMPQVLGGGSMEMILRFSEISKRAHAALSQAVEAGRDWAAYQGSVAALQRRDARLAAVRKWGRRSALLVCAALPILLWRRGRPTAPQLPSPPAPSGSETRGRLLNGCYRLERELGRGGMGVVCEAVDLNLKRAVAVKRMNLEAEQEGLGRELFLKEARLVAALKHLNIVQIYDIFEQEGRVYLVFEFVQGKTLQAPMPLKTAKKVAAQVGAALDYAHAHRVIHRDLKPSNIMIGEDGIVKVMDFGIARELRGTSATRTRGWGTPPYMAPEQELGMVSNETDLYALGVCLYEMLTGRLPFTGPDFLGQKQRLEYSREGLLPDLDRFLRKALEPDPTKRFRSAAAFSDALDRLNA